MPFLQNLYDNQHIHMALEMNQLNISKDMTALV